MFRNYWKIALRNLVRSKLYSAINISGLAIGLAVCMLIMIYVQHEYSYDAFHANASKIFWVQSKVKMENDSFFLPNLSYATGPLIKQKVPSVEAFLRTRKEENNTIIKNNENPDLKFSTENFIFSDSNFFSFFSFKLLQGAPKTVLKHPFSAVISKRAAEKYFGHQNPVGKTIRYNNVHDFTITGIAENPPSNSSLSFDFVASLSSLSSMPDKRDLILNNENAFRTYFLLKGAKEFTRIEHAFSQMAKKESSYTPINTKYVITPLNYIHLKYSDATNTKYLKVFPFVATLVLLLALINYMSLSTARATVRSKEIGIRKVMGADRKSIAFQFLLESTLYSVIAFALACMLSTALYTPLFSYLQLDIDNTFLYQPKAILSFLALLVITVLLASIYPSVILSSYKPVLALYGKLRMNSEGISIRKIFTTFQFTISVALIICGIVIYQQLSYIKQTDTGVKRQHILMIPFTGNAGKHYTAIKKDIQSIPAVSQISTSNHPMYKTYDIMGVVAKNSNQVTTLPVITVDKNFITLLGLKWEKEPVDSLFFQKKDVAILNETAVEKLNLDANPVRQRIDEKLEVAGVLKDFNYGSLQNKIDALCLLIENNEDTASAWAKNGGCMFLKINPHTNTPALINQISLVYNKYEHEVPFEYSFLDDAYDALYKAEERLSKIVAAFTAFTVIIAALGLFGLATFIAVQRTKEVGIRKVLGATVSQVTILLSKDFVKPVLLAVIIASLIAWYIMNTWLQDFAYRISISWWTFVLATVLALCITLLTISYQAIKAALANPVKSLRTE
jgi:putative ABC transport system permease protein